MNDVSAQVTTHVRARVTAAFPSCLVTSGAVRGQEATLPALLIRFTFPEDVAAARDSSGEEVLTRTVCVAESFSGTSGREAREILAVADDAMRECGFRRSNYTELPDADASVRRYSATWRACVDRDGVTSSW